MTTNICFCNNKLYIPSHDAESVNLITYKYELKRVNSGEKFIECGRIKIPVASLDFKEVLLKVVFNIISGLKCILILVSSYDGLKDLFLYSEAARNKLVYISLPQVLMSKLTDPSDISITHGPTFLLKACDKLLIYSSHSQTLNFLPYQSDFFKTKDWKILQFHHFDAGLPVNFYVIIAINLNNVEKINIVAFITDKNHEEIQYKELPVSFFIPEQYQRILKAVSILIFTPHFNSESPSFEDLSCIANLSIVCTSNDCLIFSDGILKHCCKLSTPMFDIMCIDCEFVNSISKKQLVIRAENGTIYLIKLDKSYCEVTKCWTDIKESAIGDVVLNGSKQLILLKNIDPDLWQENCIIIDILSSVNIDQQSENPVPDECLKTTLLCLQQKIQFGKLAIIENQNVIAQKTAATVDALIRLQEYRAYNENIEKFQSFRESLVDILLCHDENKISEASSVDNPVELIDEQQKFINNDWFLCFQFMNISSRSICHPIIKVVVKTKLIQSYQKCFVRADNTLLRSENHCPQVDSKVRFNIAIKISVSSVLDCEATFILTWYNGSLLEFENELLMCIEEKSLHLGQICFCRKISYSNVLKTELKNSISSLDDIFFMRLLQRKLVLQISSLHSDLSSLKSFLLKSDPNLLQQGDLNCLIFRNGNSQLFGVNISIICANEKIAIIEAFTKNCKEILLLVYFLYQHLSDDSLISFTPLTMEKALNTEKDIVCAIKNEIDLILSSLRVHNVSEELRKDYSKLMSSQTVGNITIPKETYQRIRTVLAKKEIHTDSLYRNNVS